MALIGMRSETYCLLSSTFPRASHNRTEILTLLIKNRTDSEIRRGIFPIHHILRHMFALITDKLTRLRRYSAGERNGATPRTEPDGGNGLSSQQPSSRLFRCSSCETAYIAYTEETCGTCRTAVTGVR